MKDFGRFSIEFEGFLALSCDFESDQSFAEREEDVQWIDHEILHRIKYV